MHTTKATIALPNEIRARDAGKELGKLGRKQKNREKIGYLPPDHSRRCQGTEYEPQANLARSRRSRHGMWSGAPSRTALDSAA